MMKKTLTISAMAITLICLSIRPALITSHLKEGRSPSKAKEALNFFAAQRAYPHETIPDVGHYRAYEESKYRLRKKHSLDSEDEWTSIGPVNRGGRTNALAVDPQDPNTVYAGSASGGLWRMTITVANYDWEYIDTGFPVLGVNAIAIDPTDSDIIYIGTGEVYAYQDSDGGLYNRLTRGSYGIGLLKSTDRGATWSKSIDWTYNQKRGVLVIRIDPQNPNVVFAGTTEGVYRSTDKGENWEHVHDILMAVDMVINPQNTDYVYLSCGNFGTAGHGIYRSVNGGVAGSWQKLSGGLPSYWDGKTMLDIYQADPRFVYADVANDLEDNGLYRSTDHGNSWALLHSIDVARYQGWFSHYVRVNPADNDHVINAGVNFYTSTNGGRTLSQQNDMHVDHHCFANHPTNPNIIFFGNDGGVYRSLDGGNNSYSMSTGYVTSQFYNGFSSSVLDPDFALGGLQDNGTIKYVGDNYWINYVLGGDGCFTAINTVDDNIVYGSSQNLNVYRSTNKGQSWSRIAGQFYGSDRCFIAPYVMAPSNPDIMYAGESLIYRTTNGGTNWLVRNGGQTLGRNAICSIGVSHSDPNVVYAATVPSTSRRAEVYKTTNSNMFTKITNGLPDRYYVDLQVSPANHDMTYITLSGFGTSHLYRTDDGGGSWIDIGQGLPDVPTSAVIIDPEAPDHVYVGNDLGVYVSTDNGATWSEFKTGMPQAALVMDLSISPVDRQLRAVTHGNGVYQRTLLSAIPDSDVEETPLLTKFELGQNFPNPFNPETNITFSLDKPGYVTLTIFDMQGRKIRTLAANGYAPGRHTVTWTGLDARGNIMPSGTYIYQLNADGQKRTKRMLLIR